jgi:hypothetical protein
MNIPTSGSSTRWSLDPSFGVTWQAAQSPLPHTDEIEMSGRKVSLIVRYGADENGHLTLSQKVVWPTLRTIPNNTHASLIHSYSLADCTPEIRANGRPLAFERPQTFHLDGFLTIESQTAAGLTVTRTLFPSPTHRATLELFTVQNDTIQPCEVEVAPLFQQNLGRGTKGVYAMEVQHDAHARTLLKPGEKFSFTLTISARIITETPEKLALADQIAGRKALIERVVSHLRLETPDPALNRLFDFAKLRTTESIFETARGLMHAPGGGAFYAATWCNDQCEYANPFFPFLGDATANESAINCYRQYIPFMGPDYRAIPSSIIAEGLDIWEGAGDRGDAAMYAYGAARYAMALGDPQIARELWPAIEWCLEYCERQKTPDGVIASTSDELEGRFTHGNTNLATSSLTYGALRSAAHLARSLGQVEKAAQYDQRAAELAQAIDRTFSANLSGYETYRYHEGLDLLRSWICLPLVMGIFTRREGTIAALFSPQLWTEDGLRTQEGDKTFWDRSTLYGLRGVLIAGETEKALPYLLAYSHRRLLGEHVPYPVEAYPEGNQRHLAAESALYCRIFTEGLFGMEPTGLNQFDCTPRLPDAWDSMALKEIYAFDKPFSLRVQRDGDQLTLRAENEGGCFFTETFQPGQTLHIRLA